jgi:hypothetical protein
MANITFTGTTTVLNGTSLDILDSLTSLNILDVCRRAAPQLHPAKR